MTAGATGPTLIQDTELFDKLQHFDREQIPPRNVHALGTGAYGTFTVTKDITKYSCAKLFAKIGEETDIFVRFSGIFTGKNEAETVRDPRGFAIKFYTKEGNWDLLAINTPVFNVRDAKLGPDAIHAFKRDPRSGEWNSNSIWDFVANHPEALHQTLMIFTDRDGTPASYRNMNAYGCNTFSFLNDRGERFWVKFHILSHLEPLGLEVNQAKLLAGEDPDFLSRDLRTSIQNGNHPKWTLSVQVMPEEEGYKNPWTFDCTKTWSHNDYPLIEVGTFELNRIPNDFFAEVEQAAFSPSNVVPGIGFSPDRLLQGRLFIYPDTQFHRLGSNFKQIPINAPHCPLVTPYIGGDHQMEYGKSKFPAYYPSNFGGPQPLSCTKRLVQEPPLRCEHGSYFPFGGEGTDSDYFEQPKEFISAISSRDCDHLALNMAISLSKVSDDKLVSTIIDLVRKVNDCLAGKVEKEFQQIRDGSSPRLTEGQKLAKSLCHNLQSNNFGIIQE
jgi:catalase